MKPIVNKVALAGAAVLAALLLSGCVYYPQSYGYGYGYGNGNGYYAYPYVAGPVVSGSITLGGWWWGGGDDDWHRGGWGWGEHGHWHH